MVDVTVARERDHLVTTRAEQSIEMGADESRCARDEHAHWREPQRPARP
jgi:hypothetical protein